jgi:hypothetical protein
VYQAEQQLAQADPGERCRGAGLPVDQGLAMARTGGWGSFSQHRLAVEAKTAAAQAPAP